MSFIDDIFSFVWDISAWFYNAYLIVDDWVWPFHYLSTPLYWIYRICWDLLTPIAHLSDWAYDVASRIGEILSWDAIRSLLLGWLIMAEDAWGWVKYAWNNMMMFVADWWASVTPIVQGWIAVASQTVTELITGVSNSLNQLWVGWESFWAVWVPAVTTWVQDLWNTWNHFWTVIYPNLAPWAGVWALIEDRLTAWFPFYDDLVQLWGEIALFFTNPLEFLWQRFTDWFLGPEV